MTVDILKTSTLVLNDEGLNTIQYNTTKTDVAGGLLVIYSTERGVILITIFGLIYSHSPHTNNKCINNSTKEEFAQSVLRSLMLKPTIF